MLPRPHVADDAASRPFGRIKEHYPIRLDYGTCKQKKIDMKIENLLHNQDRRSPVRCNPSTNSRMHVSTTKICDRTSAQ